MLVAGHNEQSGHHRNSLTMWLRVSTPQETEKPDCQELTCRLISNCCQFNARVYKLDIAIVAKLDDRLLKVEHSSSDETFFTQI